jgi:hypothetical protein
MNTTKLGRFIVDKDGKSAWVAASSKAVGGGSKVGVSTVGEYTGTLDRNDPVPSKPIAAMSFGQRVRIARLWAGHESLIG